MITNTYTKEEVIAIVDDILDAMSGIPDTIECKEDADCLSGCIDEAFRTVEAIKERIENGN